MKPVMALEKDLKTFSQCTAPIELRGKRRCKHIAHAKSDSIEDRNAFCYEWIVNFRNQEKKIYEQWETNEFGVNPNDLLHKEHNWNAYLEASKHLEMTGRSCITQATGTGKSIVFGAIMEDYKDEDILVITPKLDTRKDIKDKNFASTGKGTQEYLLYQNIGHMEKDGALEEYFKDKDLKLIIFDEAHRMGAKTYDKAISKLEEMYPNTKILGATATPDRTNDVNVIEKYFKGCSSSNLPLEEAVKSGVLQHPKYINTTFNVEDATKSLKTKIKEGKSEFKNLLDGQKELLIKQIEDLERKHKDNNILQHVQNELKENEKNKIVVFCDNIKDSFEKEKYLTNEIQKLYPKKEIKSIVYNSKSGKDDKEKFKNFVDKGKDDSIEICYVVDKFNEGLHVNDLKMIIMSRKSDSDIVYHQQIGRVLGLCSTENPVIIDTAFNYKHEKREEIWKNLNEKGDKYINNLNEFDKELTMIEKTAKQQSEDMRGTRW